MRNFARLLIITSLALLADPSAFAQTANPDREKTCNQSAAEHQLIGETRSVFLAECMGAHSGGAPQKYQESCSARAKQAKQQNLTGDAREMFMSGCLKDQ